MKKIIRIMVLIIFFLSISVTSVWAIKTGENQVLIPIGTKVEKKGDVTRFILADGVLEVRGLKGELLIKAYDKKGKLIYTGKPGTIHSDKTKKPIPIDKIRDKVAIDAEPIWIQFSPEPAAR